MYRMAEHENSPFEKTAEKTEFSKGYFLVAMIKLFCACSLFSVFFVI